MLLHAANPAAHSPLVVWRCTPLSYCCFILSCNSQRGSVLSHPLGQRPSCWSSEAGLWLGRETMLVKLILSWWPRGRHIPTASLSYICRLRLPSCRGLLLVRHCPWSFYGSSSVNQLLESFGPQMPTAPSSPVPAPPCAWLLWLLADRVTFRTRFAVRFAVLCPQ